MKIPTLKSRWRGLTVGFVAVVAAVVVFFRAGDFHLLRGSNPAASGERVESSQRVLPSVAFAEYEVTALTDLQEVTENLRIRLEGSVLDAGKQGEPSGASAARHARASVGSLVEEVTRFLQLRYVDRDFDHYLAWRQLSGLEWVKRDRLATTWFVAKDFEAVTGLRWSDSVSVVDAFRVLFDDAFVSAENRRLFVGVCATGVNLTLATLHGGDGDFPNLGSGQQNSSSIDHLWYGSRGATMRPWFAAKRRRLELLTEGVEVRVAVVGLPLVNKSGERVPVILEWFFDPRASRWVLEAMYISNYDGGNDFGTLNF